MRRLGAVVLAAGMIVASLYVRGRIDDSATNADRPKTGLAKSARVVCSTELAAACDALDADTTVEDAGATADRLASATGDPEMDAWIAPAQWTEIVEARRLQAGRAPLFDRSTALASTPLVLVAWNGALSCANQPTWKCVGDAAAQGLKPGHADPRTDAVGLLVLGQAAVSYFDGRTDLSSTTDLEDPGFDDWFTQLVGAVPRIASTGDPLPRMLAQGRSAFDVVGTTEVDAKTVLATAADKNRVDLLYPAPMARVVAVVAPIGGASVDDAARRHATDALVAAGWSKATSPAGLPDGGFLDALLERWKEIVG